MNDNWLNALNGVNTMVLGSIVGSVVLAFILLVIVFSLKFRTQQAQIESLHGELNSKNLEITDYKNDINKYQQNEKEAYRMLENHENAEKELNKTISDLEDERQVARSIAKELSLDIENLKKEKRLVIEGAKRIQEELEATQKVTEGIRKRNEFWVEQLSELRIKNEALTNKLRRLEDARS